MILFYIRHGEPIYDPDQLTPLGHRQADSVAKRLAMYGIDEVYASTSIRAIQTAQPTCELCRKECTTMDWMHEDHGFAVLSAPVSETKNTWIWAHPTYSQILCSREVREMGDRWYEHPAFREFQFQDYLTNVRLQTDAFLASLGYEHDREKGLYKITAKNRNKRVALFAHEGFSKIFMSELLDIPYPYYAEHFEMKHSGMTAIFFDDQFNEKIHQSFFDGYARARVVTLDNDSHLYRDGLPTAHVSAGTRLIY